MSGRGRTGYPQSVAIDVTLLLFSVLSCIAVIIIFGMFYRYRLLRRHPAPLLLWRGLADFGCCIVVATSVAYRRLYSTGPVNDISHCKSLSFFNEFFSVAAEGYFLFLTVDLKVAITNPFNDFRILSQWYHLAVLVLSTAMGLTLLLGNDEDQPLYGEDNYLSVCWIKRFRAKSNDTSPYFWAMFALPLSVMYAAALWALTSVRARLMNGLRGTFKLRLMVLANSTWFVMSYVLYWSVLGILYSAAYFINDDEPPLVLNCILAAMVGGRGLVTLAVWLQVQDLKTAIVHDTNVRHGINVREDLRPSLNVAMRSEIIAYATEGIQQSARKAVAFPEHCDGIRNRHKYNIVRLSRDAEVGLRGFQLSLVGSLSAAKLLGSKSPSRVAHMSDVLGITVGTPMSGGGGVLSSLSTANKNAAVSHGSTPYVYPEDFGGIPTMTRSRTEQAAVESAEKRHASPMPIRGGGSGGGVASSWNSARLGRLEDTGVGSYQSNNSMGLYAVGSAASSPVPFVPAREVSSGQLSQPEVVPLPQTILGSANAPSLLGQYGTPPSTAALPDGGLHSSFTSPGLASTSNVNVSTPSNSAFDEAVAAAAGHLSRTDDDGGSVTGSSSGDSFLSFASLRATSLGKPGEEDVISLNGSQHKSSVGELPAGSDVPLTDPVSGEGNDLESSLLGSGRRGNGFAGPDRPYHLTRTHDVNFHVRVRAPTLVSRMRRCLWACCAVLCCCAWRRRREHMRAPLLPGSRRASISSSGLLDVSSAMVTSLEARRRPSNSVTTRKKKKQKSQDDRESFLFRDYEPHIFRKIRTLAGITDDAYAAAMFETDKEKFNMGKSGAFLYYSNDSRFIVKTMEKEEFEVLLDILEDYGKYLEFHPNSLLTRYFGCYSLHMFNSVTYFVVMENVFFNSNALHERYDLKGSWVNRHRERIEKGQRVRCRYCSQKFTYSDSYTDPQLCPARVNHPHEPNTVMKDNDLTYKLRLGPSASRKLYETLCSDSEFLCRHDIMDYSLLLGVHRNKYNLIDKRASDMEFAMYTQQVLSRQTSNTQLPANSLLSPSPTGFDLSESPSTPQLTATVPIRGVGIAGAVIGTGGSGRYGLQRANTSTDFVASPSGRPGLLPKRVTTSPRLEPSLPPSRLGMSTPIIDELESKQSMVRSVFKTYHGGVRPCAVDGPGVYYLGVVDMLQRFTWKKRMERWMKSFYKPAAGLSSCPPVEYAKRFQRRVAGQIIDEHDRSNGRFPQGSGASPSSSKITRWSSMRK